MQTQALVIHSEISFRKKIAEKIIELAKVQLVIHPLQKFTGKKRSEQLLQQLKSLPEHTIGKEYLKILEKNDLKLIPFFEDHDLKHIVLGYGMSSEEELAMQAYLWGNGNRSIFCFLFLLSAILLPSSWKYLYQEYLKGKKAPNILNLTLKECMNRKTPEIKREYCLE